MGHYYHSITTLASITLELCWSCALSEVLGVTVILSFFNAFIFAVSDSSQNLETFECEAYVLTTRP
jgi:hypothetical protein